MAEVFELFRLSLLPRAQGELYGGKGLSREDYLRSVLAAPIGFMHYKSQLHFVPTAVGSASVPSVIIGRVGRPVKSEENQSPDDNLADVVRDTWKAALIVIDPRDHGDGQKVALEVDPKVGKPNALIASFVAELNARNPDGEYDIEVAAIIDADTFWEFAQRNKGEITALRFEFVAPNMFGGSDSITEELRDFRNVEKAQKVEVALISKDGIETDTDRIKEAVDYTVKGGGIIKARTKKKRTFNSTRKVKTTILDAPDLPDETRLVRATRWFSRILGNE